MYKAHVKKDGSIQTIKQHSENTADLCSNYSISIFKNFIYNIGLLHDIGKYQSSFQKRINGDKICVEHSICGAKEIGNFINNNCLKLIAQFCIAGHHTGIPNLGLDNDGEEESSLKGRLKRNLENYDFYKHELELKNIDEKLICNFLTEDCKKDENDLIDKIAFFTRYCFSCLTDADSIDTYQFDSGKNRESLTSNFEECLKKVNNKLKFFKCETKLQKTRSCIQKQVFNKSDEKSEIYLMNMPTGSGKTLCSLKFALERAIKSKKKRIIYIIPYNSIINQTASEFEELLGSSAQILRHQSTFDYEENNKLKIDEDYKSKFELSTENWDSQFIITTSAQFFESIYSNKRKKLRKLHNMADSVLIFDEAHLMPTSYLQPCLQAISYITKYLNSEALFLTATMPNFENLISKYAFKESKILNLIEDKSKFDIFKKCNFEYIKEKFSYEKLINRISEFPSTLVVVNTRKSAKKLYDMMNGKKYHLSTYMTYLDRQKVINEIKTELRKLEKDFPDFENIPEDRKIKVVSTSLIEAGVDMDFFTVFREFSGIDNILQAGGRCNREGKRKNAYVFIFKLENEKYNKDKFVITESVIEKYKDIFCDKSIKYYYEQIYFKDSCKIEQNSMHKFFKKPDVKGKFPFKKYSDEFEFIEDNTISIIVNQDEESNKLINELKSNQKTNMKKLNQYACSVYRKEFEDLKNQGVINDYGSGIWCLTSNDYYSSETGISFEAKDYIL